MQVNDADGVDVDACVLVFDTVPVVERVSEEVVVDIAVLDAVTVFVRDWDLVPVDVTD